MYLKELLFTILITFVLIPSACKSDKQQVDTVPVADTTMVLKHPDNVEPETTNEKQKRALMKSTQPTIARSAPVPEDPADKMASTEDPAVMTQQDMEYNEFPTKPATYPGGVAALNQYLAQHITYPAQAREHKIEGTVYANILVDESGVLGDVSFPKPLGYGLEEEVLKAIKGMPKLIPAEDQGVPVKTKFYLPVKFYLK